MDLGYIDLLVQEGFYSNRTDFIRTAIRNQLTTPGRDIGEVRGPERVRPRRLELPQLRSVSLLQAIFDAIEPIAAHCASCPS